MSLLKLDNDYANWIQNLVSQFRQSQIKAVVNVNSELLKFYWYLGKDIVEKQAESKWGSGFFNSLSQDLKRETGVQKGFSPVNLRYAKRFYLLYSQGVTILPQLAEELHDPDFLFKIPWDHHRRIIDNCKGDVNKALFFVQETFINGWSRNVLLNFLDTNLYERQGKAVNNFASTMPSVGSELASDVLKSPYNFDFLTLSKDYSEKQLKDALIQNIAKFLTEMGKGFAYMGREYRLDIAGDEEYPDILFYNVNLHAYVVVEVKVTPFKPAYVGQLGTYVVAVDHLLRREGDNKTMGILICKTKNDVVAKYALESSSQPLGISEYELQEMLKLEIENHLK